MGCASDKAIDGGVDQAVAAARNAEIVVLYLGERERMSGEAASMTSIAIPPHQMELAEAVAATGKPVVVILKHGRALALSGAARDARAILCSWFLGSESGNALADVLFGDFAPQGRLPVSFPQASGQEPYYYDHRPTGRPQVDCGRGVQGALQRRSQRTAVRLRPRPDLFDGRLWRALRQFAASGA